MGMMLDWNQRRYTHILRLLEEVVDSRLQQGHLVGPESKECFKKTMLWSVWLSWLGIFPSTEKLPVRFLVRTHVWVVGWIPGRVCVGDSLSMLCSHINVSFPLLLPSPLSKN